MFSNHVNQELSAYCNNELSAEESRRVAEHLMNCPPCRQEYEQIKFGAQLAEQFAAEARRDKAPDSLWNEVEMMLDQVEAAKPENSDHRSDAQNAKPAPQKRRWFTWPQLAFASAAMMLVFGLGGLWLYRQATRPYWEVNSLAGQPRIGSRAIGATGRIAVGEWLVTNDSSKARISVGEIGQVEIEPNSQVQLVTAKATEHRLSLAKGKMHAFIWAPPKLFFVNTPTANAVDLGCAYTLEVNDDGEGSLYVTSGWVAFEKDGRESFVPATAMCITRPVHGPGTPYFSDASEKFKAALAQFDTSATPSEAQIMALEIIEREARPRDALTLWHLLTRTKNAWRGLVYDKLTKLIQLPAGVTREGVLRGDQQMLDQLWEALDLGSTSWWRLWKAPAPPQAK